MGCSERSLRRWLAHMRQNGKVWADHALRNSHKSAALRNPALTYAILKLVVSEPVAIFQDLVNLPVASSMDYPESDHRYFSASIVYRILRRHGYTR